MKNRRHTPEQIIRKLREADQLLAGGSSVAEVARALGVSEQTYHRWRNQYGLSCTVLVGHAVDELLDVAGDFGLGGQCLPGHADGDFA